MPAVAAASSLVALLSLQTDAEDWKVASEVGLALA